MLPGDHQSPGSTFLALQKGLGRKKYKELNFTVQTV